MITITKKRKEKERLYKEQYSDIPLEYNERLAWLVDKCNLSDAKMEKILQKRMEMVSSLYYTEFVVILYEEPEGTPRPRFRLINRQNIANMAISSNQFIHVYSPTGKDDNLFMKRLMGTDLNVLNQYIYTPCIVEYNAYIKTPVSFNSEDKILAEIGLIRPIVKPDWDNIGKKYSDMYNSNVWVDDSLVISGTVNRYYSTLPRVEIKLKYLNMLYNKYQYNSMVKKVDHEINYFGKD